jgi:hypothetical protein
MHECGAAQEAACVGDCYEHGERIQIEGFHWYQKF